MQVELFLHEFFLACNQRMPVKAKFLEEATPFGMNDYGEDD